MYLNELIGSWYLVKHGFQNSKGEFLPTSTFLKGKLIYSQDGSMSVFILKNPSPESLKDIIAYSGKFTLNKEQILHHIELAPQANRIGTTEVRLYTFTKGILKLTTEPTHEGHYIIEWEKRN